MIISNFVTSLFCVICVAFNSSSLTWVFTCYCLFYALYFSKFFVLFPFALISIFLPYYISIFYLEMSIFFLHGGKLLKY